MRTEQSYPTPVHGVSTLAPRTRPQGYASKQVNFRSDPVNKLTRRPSSEWKTALLTGVDTDNLDFHTYERDSSVYSFLINKDDGQIYCFRDSTLVDTLDLGAYNGNNLGLYTIEHETYVLNKDVVVEQLPNTDANDIEKVSHINITSALNYAETIQVNITKSDGTRHSVSYTVPDLGTSDPDYDRADKARATKQVALELAARINGGGTHDVLLPNPDYTGDVSICHTPYIYTSEGGGYYSRADNPYYNPTHNQCKPYIEDYPGIAGVTAVALGSSVAIWEDGRDEWLQVEVEAGQGDRTSVALNSVVESTAGFPLYAVVGTRVTVRPDPTSDKGIYYLQAERIADTPTGEELEEVVWSEDRNPHQPHSLDNSTLPHVIIYKDGNFTLQEVSWDARRTGDEDSTPFPDFLGGVITTMGYFQKRLVVASENGVYMTETDELGNWFRQSAVQLLVTDPCGVTTSELGTDKILHLVPHNRDLLVITSNSQFKISGETAITPETVSMPLTTKYECQVSVSPVTIGNSVYFPIDYGDSTGVQEYTGERDTSQDFAAPVTNHIIGYMLGNATLMASSPNLEMIALTTANSLDNEVFVYEQYTETDGKRSQQSWSTWQFADDERVVDLTFRRNEMVIVVAKGTTIVEKVIPMYTRVTTSPLEIYLDDMLTLDTNGLTVVIPDEYSTDGCTMVRGIGTKSELWEVQYTQNGNRLTLSEDIGVGKVYLGRKFKSEFAPTRPFRYDEDGSTITTDKIRVSRWILSLVETHRLVMRKESDFSDPVEVEFQSKFVNRYPIGSIQAYTGDWKFSFAEEAGLATATFFTEGYLGCTISDVSWEGQYFQSKQRM